MPATFKGRSLDLVFFTFFASHIPIILFFDLQVIYPTWVVPSILRRILAIYVEVTKDPLIGATSPIYWFQSLVGMEGLVEFPFFFVALYGLYHDLSFIRLPMVVYSSHVVTTIIPILAEIALNPNYDGLDDMKRCMLLAIYGLYSIFPLLILVNSYQRVSSVLPSRLKSN